MRRQWSEGATPVQMNGPLPTSLIGGGARCPDVEPVPSGTGAVARPRIDPADRARQFLPFAALRGYYDLVRKQERTVEPRHELTDDEAARLSSRVASLSKGDMVRVEYYDVDAYVTVTGVLSGIDTAFRTLTVVKTKIAFDDIRSVERAEG